MKIFSPENSPWNDRVNFIDGNNVLVGYELSQCCCERADWFISDKITPYEYDLSIPKECEYSLDNYFFDVDFFEDVDSEWLDLGRMVVFRLTSDGNPDLYLHLFNSHNGYYGHGFIVKHNGEIIKDDFL